jgi:uncharacterized protein DUF3574
MPPDRFALMAVLAATLAACGSTHELACTHDEQPAIHDSLYFGTATPDGKVTPDEWADFLRTVVTPRFPQGLTVSQAAGQWLGADGEIVREESRVLQLVHPADMASEKAIREVIATYKAQFRQEAVLRVRGDTCVSF